jgi:hypothetical protein
MLVSPLCCVFAPQNLATLLFGYLISLVYNWQMALVVTGE